MKQAKEKPKQTAKDKTTKTVKDNAVITEPEQTKKEPVKRKQYKDVCWGQLREEYINTGCAMRELERKYKVPVATISRRAHKENWVALAKVRKQEKKRAKEEKLLEQRLNNNLLAAAMIDELLVKTAKAVEKLNIYDPSSIKNLTNCIKDLRDLGCFKYGVDDTKNDVTVTFAEEIEEYTE